MKNTIILIVFVSFLLNNQVYAQVSTSLSIQDTRDSNDLPNFSLRSIRADLKTRSVIGVPGTGFYSTNLTFSPWANNENSGDKNHQLNFNNGGIFYRSAFPTDNQWGNWRQLLVTDESGNVGIGTLAPAVKLDVMGTIKSYEPTQLGTTVGSFQLINDRGGNVGDNTIINRLWTYRDGTLNNWYNSRLHDGISIDNSFKTPNLDTRTWWERDPNDNIQSWGNTTETYVTINKGNVGIGTTNPTSKLTVAGNINSREVKVTVDAGADFVFENNYNLPSLDSVDKYIKENKHLPEIASADEMKKQGINLSEMNIKLLQKIEEMTLYMIEKNKQIHDQKREIKKRNSKFQINI